MRKAAFDQAPAGGEIRIAIGQGPDRVQVIRKDNGSFDREGMACAHLAKRRPQQDNMIGQQAEPAVGQVDRKEVAAAG
jgi:anti-sigma regulatory factor (Ser/Thr protein kinase)